MTVPDLAEDFLRARPRLVRIAYAVLGSYAEAEDVVSDCWFRLTDAHHRDPVRDVEAWTTVAVARMALDVLRSARVRRENYVGPWLPEPVVAAADDPAEQIAADESVSFALLVVLESLSPAERTSWVLHDLFGIQFDEVADILGRTPASVRQAASRARRRVTEGASRFTVDPVRHGETVRAFARAAESGDTTELLAVLDPSVVLTSDGGGIVSAARRPVVGADRVARFLLGIAAKVGPTLTLRPCRVNGRDGLALSVHDAPAGIVSFDVDARGRVARIDLVRSPEKLTAVTDSVWR